MQRFLLIPDYRTLYNLSDDQCREWAVLDLFDCLSPDFDQPQTLETVRRWFRQARLVETDIRYGFNGIVGRGTKPV